MLGEKYGIVLQTRCETALFLAFPSRLSLVWALKVSELAVSEFGAAAPWSIAASSALEQVLCHLLGGYGGS